MTNTLPPIIFFGTDDFSLTALTALIEADYPIAAVVTKPDTKQGRGHKITQPVVKTLALSHNIPVWQPQKLSEITESIAALGAPVGILSSYGKIIPQRTIDLFHPGIINIHPSLLPQHRGPTPIETAIAQGDSKTGVSIMQLAAGMDNGPVYAAKEYALTGRETSLELYHTLAVLGANLLLETLPSIIDSSLTPHAQDDAKATFTRLLSKDDAWLDPKNIDASSAEQQIRAFQVFPKTKLRINDHIIIITKAHVADDPVGSIDIACSDGRYLAIDEVIAPSGRRMSADDFARGYLRT